MEGGIDDDGSGGARGGSGSGGGDASDDSAHDHYQGYFRRNVRTFSVGLLFALSSFSVSWITNL